MNQQITALKQAEALTGKPVPADISMRDFGRLVAALGCRVIQRGFDLVLVPELTRV